MSGHTTFKEDFVNFLDHVTGGTYAVVPDDHVLFRISNKTRRIEKTVLPGHAALMSVMGKTTVIVETRYPIRFILSSHFDFDVSRGVVTNHQLKDDGVVYPMGRTKAKISVDLEINCVPEQLVVFLLTKPEGLALRVDGIRTALEEFLDDLLVRALHKACRVMSYSDIHLQEWSANNFLHTCIEEELEQYPFLWSTNVEFVGIENIEEG